MTTMKRSSRLLSTAMAAGLAARGGAPAVPAKEEYGPVAKRLASLEIGPGSAHRYVIVHPLFAVATPAKKGEEAELGGLAEPALVAFGKLDRASRPKIE